MNNPSPPVDPALVTYLRRLVTALSLTMIGGFAVIVTLLVIRFAPAAAPDLPDSIALPPGTSATAFTQGRGWFAVVTDDDRILIYDREGGTLRQTVDLRVQP